LGCSLQVFLKFKNVNKYERQILEKNELMPLVGKELEYESLYGKYVKGVLWFESKNNDDKGVYYLPESGGVNAETVKIRINMKNEEKTVIEWLNEAKEHGYEWAQAAIYNHENQFDTIKNGMHRNGQKIVVSLSDALLYGFEWRQSKEGFIFWDEINTNLLLTASIDL